MRTLEELAILMSFHLGPYKGSWYDRPQVALTVNIIEAISVVIQEILGTEIHSSELDIEEKGRQRNSRRKVSSLRAGNLDWGTIRGCNLTDRSETMSTGGRRLSKEGTETIGDVDA